MAFNTLYFPVFLFVAALAFYAAPKPGMQKVILVIASLAFAASFSIFSALALVVLSVANFLILKKLAHVSSATKKQRFYLAGVVVNILSLAACKLLQEVFSNYGLQVLQGFDNSKWVILGFGFYTLQVIGYFFEVYKRRANFNLSFIQFFLTLAFFSKLPAGPILNLKQATTILNNERISFEEGNFSYGVQRLLLGLFKKIALADRLLPYVHAAFDNHEYLNGLNIYLAPILFTLQLYFDFSGYIDMGVGSARIFGIRLPENFSLPLRAKSISEFWRRWHISLVNWLTNYVFYPISYRYRKAKNKGIAVAVVCTFLVSALWHGFALTFFVWAACHFTYIILENVFNKKADAATHTRLIKKIIQVMLVWHLVAFSNIFFRSPTLKDAMVLFQDFARLPFLYAHKLSFKTWVINGGQDIENEFNYRFAILLSLLFLVFERKINRYAQSEKYNIVYVALMIVALVALGMFNTGERFIYLQF